MSLPAKRKQIQRRDTGSKLGMTDDTGSSIFAQLKNFVERTLLMRMMRPVAALLCLLLVAGSSFAAYNISPDSIHKHIAVLASDSLEGREVGEAGEWKAAQYIIGEFKSAGLLPKGTNGQYLQPFDFIKRISLGPKNRLVLNGKELQLNKEFTPLQQSANKAFNFSEVVSVGFGIKTEDSSYDDYSGKNVEGKAVLIERFSPKAETNPKVDFSKYESLSDKIAAAIGHKAAGIFFVTPSGQDDSISATGITHVTPKDIPIVFLRRKGLERLGINPDSATIASAVGETELIPVADTGYNVVGYLPGRSDSTIIVGAHYDHLGYGGPASRYTGTERLIHHGADDNGSGTAGLLELARYFATRRESLNHSILFIAFSGEEAGILGSSWYVRHWTVDSSKIRMMLNMDMIGRLRDQENGLAVFGTGTAAEFKSYFDSLKVDSVKFTFREPGTGPSDHTAFYNNQIPVLHFFTGAHEDYHKPSDVVEKIDLGGTVKVVNVVADVAAHFDHYPHNLTFQKTKDPEEGKHRSQFSVTLGVMPDYVAQVKGVKVDGVSPDKPAERAGIKKGDIVIKLGPLPIDDIYAYMAALGKFHKGDSTTVVIQRGADTLSLPIVFK
jgi:aminopeptidase YwaD